VAGALSGSPDVAVGNVVGSNIFNVLFILGVSAAITPLVVDVRLVRVDVPLMVAVSAITLALAWDGRVGRLEGGLLMLGLLSWTGYTLRAARREERGPTVGAAPTSRRLPSLLVALLGLAVLVVGARLCVQGAVGIARGLGVPELVIGLTVIAAGTSLPEVAASVVAALRGERDLAVGNVVGSNLFNLLGVLGLSAAVAPSGLAVAPAARTFDLPFMVAAAAACLPIVFSAHRISRIEGLVLLGWEAAYLVLLGLSATDHAARPVALSLALGFALPLTLVGLGFGVVQARRLRRTASSG
jgi:cation:H+ antiporter